MSALAERHRRSRKLLSTTETLLSAIELGVRSPDPISWPLRTCSR